MDLAITMAEFHDLMRQVVPPPPAPMAVACSGGPDSMALTALSHRWARANNVALTALVVDHGLRANSREEASKVAGWLLERGVGAVVLTADTPPPRSNIQQAARDLRYRLMTTWCADNAVGVLALAHHQNDQAETFLLRLGRGSGVDGLAAMRPVSRRGDLMLIRPLLDTPKARLQATLRALDWPSVADPSNENEAFARVRIRKLMPLLADEGLDAARLARTARRMSEAAMALDFTATALLGENARIHDQGFATLDPGGLTGVPTEIALRALSKLLAAVGGGDYPPRLDRVERLLAVLRSGAPVRGRTSAGCRIVTTGRAGLADATHTVLICREMAAIAEQPACVGDQVWDGRFKLRLSGDVGRVVLGPLGVEGWRRTVVLAPDLGRNPPGPAAVRRGLPGIWIDGSLAAIPSLEITDTRLPGPKVEVCALVPRLKDLCGAFHSPC